MILFTDLLPSDVTIQLLHISACLQADEDYYAELEALHREQEAEYLAEMQQMFLDEYSYGRHDERVYEREVREEVRFQSNRSIDDCDELPF